MKKNLEGDAMTKSKARLIEASGLLSAIVERDIPTPRAGELLLRVHATSVNYHDLLAMSGGIPGLPIPRVPFSDASATVAGIGVGVEGFAIGDAVVPNFFINWRSGAINSAAMSPVLGDQVDGALQTYVGVPSGCVARSPNNLSHEEIATLGCAALTAWRSLVLEAKIQPGQTVLLQGTGGVSLAALAFARMLGARIIITSSSDEKLARARALGAHEGINYRTTPNWEKAVLERTDGQGVDVVVELGGGETLHRSIRAVKIGGHISIIGVLAGFEAPSFPLGEVMGKNVTVRGITVGSTESLNAMCRAIEINGYKPVIDTVYDLGAAHDAIAHVRKQTHFGKVVIRVA